MVFCVLTTYAVAQGGTITGVVKDASGNPLSGASVTVEGKTFGTTTDANGAYNLKVPAGTYQVSISYVGQSSQKSTVTVLANGTATMDFSLSSLNNLDVVEVVGSRSRLQRSNVSTPVPVDIISMKEIKNFPQADVSQMLTYAAPSFQSARQTITDGTDHIDPAGLRGLGPDQTLMLVNGKRRHNTALVNINGSVGRGSVGTDLNTIPASAIERIEVLRDGAAAQYGSDAIAGVINVVLKKKYKGFNVSVLGGQNFTEMPNGDLPKEDIRDGHNYQVDFYGGNYAKNGAYFTVSGQWLQRAQSNRSGLDNIPLLYYGSGGAFPTGPSSVGTAVYRQWLMQEDAKVATQNGYDRHNIVAGNSYSDNFTGFINAGMPVGKKSSLYFTGGAGSRSGYASGFSRNPNAITQMPANAAGTALYPNGFLPQISTAILDKSAIVGFKTELLGFNVDLSNTYGVNTLEFTVNKSGNSSLPATGSMAQSSFEAGNIRFSQNTVNLDLSKAFEFAPENNLNLAFGGEFRRDAYRINKGEEASYLYGSRTSVSTVVPAYPGTTPVTVTGTTVPGAQVFPGFQPTDVINRNRQVYAGYIDLEYNYKKLLIGGAARFESYNEDSVTYNGTGLKLTARYEVVKNWALRGSISTGFRAPSLQQRYFQNTSTQFVNGLPSNALTANNENPIVRNAFGINELKPETSLSYTAGFTGKMGGGFTITVDGYIIKIDDRIVLSTQFARSNPLVSSILTANNVPTSVSGLQFWANAINTETKGIDVVLNKSYKLGKGNGNISLAANFTKTEVVGVNTNSVIDAPGNNPSNGDPSKNPANDLSTALFDRQQRARVENGTPNSKINFTVSYSLPKWNFLLRAVRFGEVISRSALNPYAVNGTGVFWNDVAFGADQNFSAKITTDVVVTYNILKGISASIGANNLFDVYPDQIYVDPRNSLANVSANPVASALGTSKTVGGYAAGRDLTNRGRFLFNGNQFGYNGRFLFFRVAFDVNNIIKGKK